MAAKFEDLKYPFFSTMKRFYQDEMIANKMFEEEREFQDFDVLSYEALVFSTLQFDMYYPCAIRFFERLSRASGIKKNSMKYQIGMYFLHILAFYPGMNFEAS